MTPQKTPDIIKITARKLRQEMTEAEKILWKRLENRKLCGKKFLRQSPIYVFTENSGLDRYIIADFVCKEYKLIIELDGSIHNLEEIYVLDREKEILLENIGYKILRCENGEVKNNLEKVLRKIKENLS